jgi:ubiquinone/menaquinone biosynthesis C-methylase UbiE
MRNSLNVGTRFTHRVALICATLLVACTGQQSIDRDQVNHASNSSLFSESEAYERFMGGWSRQLAPLFLEFSGLEEGDSVLDIGSGTGALAEALLSETKSSRVLGVDPSTGYVTYAESRTDDDGRFGGG